MAGRKPSHSTARPPAQSERQGSEVASLPASKQNRRFAAVVGAVLLVGAVVACLKLTSAAFDPRQEPDNTVRFLALFGVLLLLFGGGLLWLRAQSLPKIRVVGLVFGVGLLLRLILLPGPPIADDDIYRYRWDGKLLAQGQNPYALPPLTPELGYLQDPLFERIGFTDVPTVYPPVSQVLFAAGYALTPDSILGLKIVFTLSDTLAVIALLVLLGALGRSPKWAALYAWNPIVLKEFANSGHHDSAGIALLLCGLWLIARSLPASGTGRRGRGEGLTAGAALCLGLATLVKPVLLLLAPAFVGRLRGRDFALWGGVVVAAYLPFSGIGLKRLFAGIAIYTRHWEMNDSVFALTQAAFGGMVPTNTPGFMYETHSGARLVSLSLWAVAAAWILADALRERRGLPLSFGPQAGGIYRTLWRLTVLLTVVLMLTPTMDPWYLCWLIPLLCIFPIWPLLLWTATVGLYYVEYAFREPKPWVRVLEYGPVYGGLLLQAVGRFFRRPGAE